jgi:GNAT superfamily N-acetyltransferase
MTYIVRTYQPGDEKAIVEAWQESLPHDPITPELFRAKVLLDANFDPEGAIVAVNEYNQVVGFTLALVRRLPMSGDDLEPENGWISTFFVHPRYRKQGIGTKMFQQAKSYINGKGRKHLFFASYAPNYFLPGIDEELYPEGYKFLLKHGFVKLYSPVAMDLSLVGFTIPDEVKQLKQTRELEGFRFTHAEDRHLYNLIQFANTVFNPDWGRAIREGILQGLPMDQIFVIEKENQIVGFCLYGGYEGISERFGPFGVDPSMQGKGLGKILLYQCLFEMRAKGLHGAWFLWTGEKSTAGHLYKKVDFKVTRRFHVMRCTLNQE